MRKCQPDGGSVQGTLYTSADSNETNCSLDHFLFLFPLSFFFLFESSFLSFFFLTCFIGDSGLQYSYWHIATIPPCHHTKCLCVFRILVTPKWDTPVPFHPVLFSHIPLTVQVQFTIPSPSFTLCFPYCPCFISFICRQDSVLLFWAYLTHPNRTGTVHNMGKEMTSWFWIDISYFTMYICHNFLF